MIHRNFKGTNSFAFPSLSLGLGSSAVRSASIVLTLLFMLALTTMIAGCGGSGGGGGGPAVFPSTYRVSYNGNGSTAGSVPVDAVGYAQGETVTVLGNTENLVRTGYIFKGWNTAANDSGTSYSRGQTFTMGSANVTLYAQWATASGPSSTGYAFVVNTFGNNVSQYTIGADGSITANGADVPVDCISPQSIAVDPLGRYAYVSAWDHIAQYTITNGQLQHMSPNVAAAYPTAFVTVDPTDHYVYASGRSGAPVSQYTIQSGGALQPMTPNRVEAWYATALAVHPSGKYAYGAKWVDDHNVYQFNIGVTGGLTLMSNPTVSTGNAAPVTSVVVDPSGRYVYVAGYGEVVSQFTVGTDGSLTAMTPSTIATGGVGFAMAVDPSGKYIYVGDYHGISEYQIGADGKLVYIAGVSAPCGVNALAIKNRYVYAVNNCSSAYIQQYFINFDGTLSTFGTRAATGKNPSSIAIAPAP